MRVTVVCATLLVFVCLVLLGNWQLRRLAWKQELIDTVTARAFQPPVAPPTHFDVSHHRYARVAVTGVFDHDLSQRVKAVTELGPGHWLMAPLVAAEGVYWINRGFVPSGSGPADWVSTEGTQTILGHVRASVPLGTLLEKNDPTKGRWFSPDTAQLSTHAGLSHAEPFYIAAEHALAPDAWPRGGLMPLTFRNNHLSYALTWYAMAAGLVVACVYVLWDSGRRRGTDSNERGQVRNDQPASEPPQQSTR